MDKIVIVARAHEDARYFARENNIPRDGFVYLDSREKILMETPPGCTPSWLGNA